MYNFDQNLYDKGLEKRIGDAYLLQNINVQIVYTESMWGFSFSRQNSNTLPFINLFFHQTIFPTPFKEAFQIDESWEG